MLLDEGQRWRVDQGDCIQWLDSLPADSVDLVFCSPPYEQARLYLENGQNLGIARNTEEWVSWMVEVVRACSRVCRGLIGIVCDGQTRRYRYSCAPLLLAADLHRAGFCLRKPAVYRRVGIPGSGGPDWLRNDWEPVLCITRPGKLPWSDNTACGHPPKWAPGGEMSHRLSDGQRVNQWGHPIRKDGQASGGDTPIEAGRPAAKRSRPSHRTKTRKDRRVEDGSRGSQEQQQYEPPVMANPGNVIDCSVGGGQMGSPLAHENEAPFPEQLASFFVRSFCPPGGIVVDPFSGSGTTGAVAIREGRRFLGCDLRESQVKLSRRRLSEETPSLFGGME